MNQSNNVGANSLSWEDVFIAYNEILYLGSANSSCVTLLASGGNVRAVRR